MTDLLVDDFSGGMTDIFIDGPKEAGYLFDNILIDIHGKPYQRPGSDVVPIVEQLPSGVTRLSQLWFWRLPIGAQFAFLLAFSNTKLYKTLCSLDAKGKWQPSGWQEVLGPTITGLYYSGGNVALATASSNRPFLTTGGTFARIHPFANGTDHYLIPGSTDITNTFDDKAFLVRKLYFGADTDIHLTMAGLPAINGGAYAGAFVPNVGTPGATHSYLYAFTVKHTYKAVTAAGVEYVVRSPVYTYPTTVLTLNPIGIAPNQVTWAMAQLFNSAATPNPTLWDLDNLFIEIWRTKDAGQVFYKVLEAHMGTLVSVDNLTDAQLGEPLYTNGGSSDTASPGAARFGVAANDANWFSGVGANPFSDTETVANNVVLQGIPGAKDTCADDFITTIDGGVTGLGQIDIYPVVFCESSCYRLEGILDAQGRGATVVRPISTKIGCISHDGIVNLGRVILFPSLRGWYMTDGYDVQPISEHLLTRYKRWTQTQAQKTSIGGRFDVKNNRVYWTMRSYAGITSNLTDNDILVVLDLNKPMTKTSCFTTWSGGRFPINFSPTSICVNEGYLIRGDSRGYLIQHDDTLNTDPVINTATSPTVWMKVAVFYNYISCAYAMGTQRMKKWATWVMATFLNEKVYSSYDNDFDTATLDVSDINNPKANISNAATYFWPGDIVGKRISFSGNKFATNYKIIQVVNVGGVFSQIVLEDPFFTATSVGAGPWDWVVHESSGKISCQINSQNEMTGIWKPLKLVSLRAKTANDYIIKRFFPAGGLRFTFKQLQMTNGYDTVYRSDDFATVTVTDTVATLTAGSWPVDIAGLYLHRYVNPILPETTGTLIASWSGPGTVILTTAPGNGTFKWAAKGYPLDEKWKLQSYTLPYNPIGESITPFTTAEGNNNT